MENDSANTTSTTSAVVMRIINREASGTDIPIITDCFRKSAFPERFSTMFINSPASETVTLTAMNGEGDVLSRKFYATYLVTIYCNCDGDAIAEINNACSKFMRLLCEQFKHARVWFLANDTHALTGEI